MDQSDHVAQVRLSSHIKQFLHTRKPGPLRKVLLVRDPLANVNPKIVSEALGHATVGITLDTYSHVLPSMSRTAAEAIEAVFGER